MPAASEPTFKCWQCQDDPQGWLELWCPDTVCERAKDHPPHSYVVRCPHWLREHGEELHKAAQDALQKGRRPGAASQALQELETGVYRYQRAVTTIGRRPMPATETA